MAKTIATCIAIRKQRKRWNACRHNYKVESIFRRMNRINNKSDKELAFLQDLFIAPDWGERFAELIDEHVTLPNEGKALYAAAGTGGHALALQERAGTKLELL